MYLTVGNQHDDAPLQNDTSQRNQIVMESINEP